MAWKRDADSEARPSDVLGVGDVKPDKEPRPGEKREGVGPAGEVVPTADRMGGLRRSKGATGIDMGAGGEGTDIEP